MTLSDIQNSIYFRTNTNATSFTNANMLILLNRAYSRVASLILKADGRWEWDDTNNTDLPVGTTALVASQQDYSLPATFLKLNRVELKDTNSMWRQLIPYDNADYDGTSITALSNNTGLPYSYDVLANSVFLFPVPNYSQAASLKFYFQRAPTDFTSAQLSAGTATPGFNSLYHDLLPLWVSYEYAVANNLPQANGYFLAIQRLEAAIQADYGARDKDDPPRMTMAQLFGFK